MLVGVMLVVFTVQMVNDFAVLNSFAIFMPVVYGGGVRVLVVVRLRLLSPMFSGGTRFAGGGACPVKARMSTSHVEATLVTRWWCFFPDGRRIGFGDNNLWIFLLNNNILA
ncbi:hypothetical protein F2Q68_00006167 [Brassica cretica]|uniref:Uncharacterized protein n=1 Tax=Brassica cretica TaxID=69181 RepID=A0A8S9J8H2_BRACR|nr:hypothetical protein F2Q68_00006167 [Brassica cretica]